MSKVDSTVEEFSHCYNSHDGVLLHRLFLLSKNNPLGYWFNNLLNPSHSSSTSELDRNDFRLSRMSAEMSPDCSGAGEILPEVQECKIHALCAGMGLLIRFLQTLGGYVGINLRCCKRCVSQNFLHSSQICPAFEQMSCS